MAQITLGALDVKVADGTTYEVEQYGDVGRAFSGKMRSDIRAHHRVFRVVTPPLSTSDMQTLRSALMGTQPLSVSGDMIGTASNFHARDFSFRPVTADDWVVSFTLHETNDF